MTATLTPVPFEALASADLTVGRIYKGGTQPNVGADPLHKLTGVGNSGGFRVKNVKGSSMPALCVLFSTGAVSEWPDGWDSDGNYVYYGDQRVPGKDVLETPRKGNRLLADVRRSLNLGERGRVQIPPFLLFEKAGSGRDVRFEGLLVPAAGDDWLTVDRRLKPEGQLVNYRAVLTRLPVSEVSRMWLTDITGGQTMGASTPAPWLHWVSTGGSV